MVGYSCSIFHAIIIRTDSESVCEAIFFYHDIVICFFMALLSGKESLFSLCGDIIPQRLNIIFASCVQALIWSKMSTGLPIEIFSSMKGQTFSTFCRLDIDIHRCADIYSEHD